MVTEKEAVNIMTVLAEFIDGFRNYRIVGTPDTSGANSIAAAAFATESRDNKVRCGNVPGGLSHFKFFDDAGSVRILEEALKQAALAGEYGSALKKRVDGNGAFAIRDADHATAARAAYDTLIERDYASYFEPQAPPERNTA